MSASSCPTSRERRGTRSTRFCDATTRRSSSSTPRGLRGNGSSGRGSSTTRASRARGCRARGRRTRPDRRRPGHGRAGSSRGRRRPQGAVRDDRRPLEVGRHRDPAGGDPAGHPHPLRQRPPIIAISAHSGRGLERLLAMIEDVFVRYAGGSRPRSSTGAAGAARGPAASGAPWTPPEPPLRDAGELAAASVQVLRQRPQARHARLRLLGRERAARAVRAGGRPRVHRLRHVRVRVVVVGAGSWGTAGGVPPPRQRARRDARGARSRAGGTRSTGRPAIRATRPMHGSRDRGGDDRRCTGRRRRPRRRRGAESCVRRGRREAPG